jgi:LemA protein
MKNFSWFLVSVLSIAGLQGCGVQSIPRQLNEVESAWAEVLNQYQRRSDLIPNLVNVVKGYASHERETLEAVTNARAAATQVKVDPKDLSPEKLQEFSQAQQGLGSAISRLLLVAERYPDLKANENFRDLQVQLEGTENRITVARNRYIEQVKNFNNLVSVFPTNLTNSIFFKHEKKAQFSVANEAEAAKAPEVKF